MTQCNSVATFFCKVSPHFPLMQIQKGACCLFSQRPALDRIVNGFFLPHFWNIGIFSVAGTSNAEASISIRSVLKWRRWEITLHSFKFTCEEEEAWSRLNVQSCEAAGRGLCLPCTWLTELQHSKGIISTFPSLKSNLNNLYLYSSCGLRGGKPIVHTDVLSPLFSMSCLRKQITKFFFPVALQKCTKEITDLVRAADRWTLNFKIPGDTRPLLEFKARIICSFVFTQLHHSYYFIIV